MDLELISFKICPFVQRSVITLKYKEVPFRITYIDLANPPDWFREISPFGKVPLLRVDGSEVLFESAVINEFVDEITPPSLQPQDPLKRALNRAWIEFGSECLSNQFQMLTARDAQGFADRREELQGKLTRLEKIVSDGPYFNGPDFSLVDAAYAPLFMRIALLIDKGALESSFLGPRLQAWSDALLALPAVRGSVVDDFEELFLAHLNKMGGYVLQAMAEEA
ncbi:MAG: glutathione S-transferase family protein [Gammaproteobacteria bacterium]